MTPEGSAILDHLAGVAAERQRRSGDAGLAARTAAVKSYQHARFTRAYADMLAHPRYAAATRFFLDDLYGPRDFSERDDQFARIVGPLVRLFPRDIVVTVTALAELHALSEVLDSAMAVALPQPVLEAGTYGAAWRAVGRADARERQIALMLDIGTRLGRYVRNPLLRQSLRVMRGPARAAGLSALQDFMERGFETFRAMGDGADALLSTIARRERALAAALFADDAAALGQLP